MKVISKAEAKKQGLKTLPPSETWRNYAKAIAAAWQRTTESETGRLLNEAKDTVDHGDWMKLCEVLPFTVSTAERLMKIASNSVLSNSAHVQILPPSWGTLYEVSRLPDKVLLAKIEDGTINVKMERKEVAALLGPEPPRKRNTKPTTGETYAVMAQEIEDHKAHIAELEAARETQGVFIDAADDDATLAAKIGECIGHVRLGSLIVELQRLRDNDFADETEPPKLH